MDQLQNTVDIVVEDDLHDFSESPDPITRRPRRWRVKLLGLTEWEADGSLVPATPDKEFKISLDWELVFRGDNRATAQILAHELLHVVQDVETGLMGRRQKEVAPEWIENVIWDESRKKAKTP